MSAFGAYAAYYDLLYRDKDYQAEADYVLKTLRSYRPVLGEICEFGCGTGRFAELLAARGLQVHGVDLSPTMLEQARERQGRLPAETAGRLRYSPGDIRSVRLEKRFDAVVALFHVISYLNDNVDLQQAFATVREHLAPGGIFVFDFWYGPAVLTERPSVRVARIPGEGVGVLRIAEPVIHWNRNVVDVHYQILVSRHGEGAPEEFREVHSMRYLFIPELKHLLAWAGLEFLAAREWLGDGEPRPSNWGACVVARRPPGDATAD